VIATSKRSAGRIVRQAGRFAVQSARKETPRAKNRKMQSVERWSHKRKVREKVPSWATHRVISERGGVPKKLYARSREQALKLRVPKYRGAAKAAWSGALSQLGANPGRIAPSVYKLAARESKVGVSRRDGEIVSVKITNRLDYVSKIAPRAAVIGVQRATRRVEAIYLKQLERDAAKAFRTGRRVAGRIVG
jgi:hypothetical protein